MTAGPPHRGRIYGGFWGAILERNAREAIFYQWEQLERTGCIDNFRIAAGWIEGFREGMFFADSDAYKWLDAAARILAAHENPRLTRLVDDFITLLEAAQMPDGYLYTYNQIHFPGQRWVNLRLEHELYCHGHLIEAGLAHHQSTGATRLLDLVRRSADLLASDFVAASPQQADGHEEIEIALVRLYRVTGERRYLDLAQRFLERRGRSRFYPLAFLKQISSTGWRMRSVARRRRAYLREHPERDSVKLPAGNRPRIPALAPLRLAYNMLSGRSFQQNAPIRQQTVPVGHAVCFTYLATAAAMVSRETGDISLVTGLEEAWERMVTRRMYVTGGIGSVPLVEGFGRDFELDPEIAYAETCAAIGGLLWNHEMSRLTNQPRYEDLFEWQLYNAAMVGAGADMRSYFYNNPLACRGGIARAPWYFIPCCPSNLSRTWAALDRYAFRVSGRTVHLSQYLSGEIDLDCGTLKVDSGLPWNGTVRIDFDLGKPQALMMTLRLPAWADHFDLRLNGHPIVPDSVSPASPIPETACGYAPHAARRLSLQRAWAPGDTLELSLGMPLRLHRQHRKVRGCSGKVALSRGPLVYCLESVDNSGDLFPAAVRADSLQVIEDHERLGGIYRIDGVSSDGSPLVFVPYFLWGNRGASRMNVFFSAVSP
jgi:DUF1680 family protein